jgi:Flp pilus assembly protein TadG
MWFRKIAKKRLKRTGLFGAPPESSRGTRFRLDRDESGATAVEFAMVSVPFFALVFALLEISLRFFAGQVLETAVSDAARMIRTGQAQALGFDVAAFRTQVCGGVSSLMTCDPDGGGVGGFRVDVRTYADFSSVDLSNPLAGNPGEEVLDESSFAFNMGSGGEIVLVRVFYEWPSLISFNGTKFGNLGNGNHLLAATAAFRNEPF